MTCAQPVIGQMSIYTSSPCHIHWIVVQRMLKCSKRTMNCDILYNIYHSVIEGCIDVSLNKESEGHKSINGCIFTLSREQYLMPQKNKRIVMVLPLIAKFITLTSCSKELK